MLRKSSVWWPIIPLLGLIVTACGGGDSPASTGGSTEFGDAATTTATSSSSGMSGVAADEMAEDVPFDLAFIDSMIQHHRGAIDMAEQAQVEAEQPELRSMARAVIDAQVGEIAQMEAWREEWYLGETVTAGMDMPMGEMELSDDDSIPFDQRFITAMIAHHEGAVGMAEAALTGAVHEEIRTLAQEMIEAQQAKIEQMRAWEADWFAR